VATAIGRFRSPAEWIEFTVHGRSFFCVGMLGASQRTLSLGLPALGADAYRLKMLSLVTHGAATRVAETRANMHLDSYGWLTLANATCA
jgi:arginine deiminase